MDARDVHAQIKSEITLQKWTLTAVVEEMNRRHPSRATTVSNISNKLTRGTIKYSEVIEIADIIGVKIEWRKGDENNE